MQPAWGEMGRRVRLGTLFGVEVALDWSWIATFVLAAWTLVVLFARVLPGVGVPTLIVAGTASAAGLFVSLVLHEIVHGLVARARGVPVRRITLFLLGGITDIEGSPSSPKTDALAALASPATNLVAAIGLTLGLVIANGPVPRGVEDLDRLGAPGLVVAWLAIANAGIAVTSLLPAYPLDGGRLLRAAIWQATGDVERATRWAAWVGQLVGWLLVVLGFAVGFGEGGEAVVAGMWAAFVGWFVASAAAQSYRELQSQDALAGVIVDHVMRRSFVAIPAELTVAVAMRTFLARADGRSMPVVDGRDFVGLLSIEAVRELPVDAWPETRAGELAAARPARTATPNADVLGLLPVLDEVELLPVLDGTRLVGILDRHDVARWVETRAARAALRRSEAT